MVSEESEKTYDLSELEKRVTNISAFLEVACEDTSLQLEKTVEDVSRTVPRLTYDVQLMHENALSLHTTLREVELQSRSTISSKDIGSVFERLSFLDTVKRNMEASLAVLKEAESWSSLESEVVSFLSEQSYAKAASRLSEAASSLGIFENTPEFENRRTLLTNLQNQLEASLSSALVAAINSNDVDACKNFFGIFCQIQRESEFRSYWNGSKRNGLVTLWQETALQDCGEASTVQANQSAKRRLSSFLVDFYHDMLSVLQTERISVVMIFPDPQLTLSTFITSTLSSFHPTISQRLNALAGNYGDLVLPEIIAAFKATEEFAMSTEKVMEKIGYSTLSSALTSSADDREIGSSLQRTHSRRLSKRQSFSRRLNRSSLSGTGVQVAVTQALTQDHSWEDALFEPFLEYQCDYATFEKRLLRARLKDSLKAHTSSSAGARLLREHAVDVLALADDALTRCMAFTHGYGAVGLIQSVDDLFETFFDISARNVLHSGTLSSPDAKNTMSSEDFAELDYSASDLAYFQIVLHLLEESRSILERLDSFESKLCASLVQASSAIKMLRNDPLGSYISSSTKGESALLHGSALNSIELQSLFDEIDPDRYQVQNVTTPYTPGSAPLATQKTITAQPGTLLLSGARKSITNFAKTCQTRMQSTILTPLLKHLSAYPSSQLWTSFEPSKDRQGTGGASEVVIPTFSLSPSLTIQRVAEGLLTLPRLFEVYADDDALSFSIETLPFVDEEILRIMTEGNVPSQDATEKDIRRGDTLTSPQTRPRHLSSPSLAVKVLPTSQKSLPTLILTPEAVISTWLASLALTLLSHLTSVTLPSIPSLTTNGAAQLLEDLGYLSQIAKALNVEWGDLECWREAVGLNEEDMKKKIVMRDDSKSTDKDSMYEILQTVARLRGWTP